jgi:hypothetical protein
VWGWGSHGKILEHHQERGTAVKCLPLWDVWWTEASDLKQMMRTTVRRSFIVAWQCLSTPFAVWTVETLRQLHCEVFEHPLYSPDLAYMNWT